MKLLLGLMISVCLMAPVALAKQLGSVIIEGVDTRTARNAKEIIQSSFKANFTLNDLHQIVQNLYDTGQFNGIDVYLDDQGEKTDVVFHLSPLRNIKSINLRGNSSFSTSDLMNEFGVSEGEPFVEDKLKLGVEAIKKFFNLGGYLNAQVSADFTSLENSPNIAVNIRIAEGLPCVISKITFLSVNEQLNRKLEKLFDKDLNKAFTQNLLDGVQNEAAQYLSDQHYLSTSIQAGETLYNPTKTSVALNFGVSDPYSYALVFEGNEAFNGAKIQKELKLDSNNRLSSSPIDDLTERTIKFYKKSGYANIEVRHKENLFTQDYVRRVNFIINEGPRVRIKDLIVEGSFSRPTRYYSGFVYDHSGDLISKKYYNSEDIDDGIKNLVIDLQNQGFISAKVPSSRVDFDKKRESVVIKINLEEGPQTFVDKIIFKGTKSIPRTELEQTIGLKAGAPLQLNSLADASSKITELYKSKGYLDAQVINQGKSLITYSSDNTKATLTFDISEGPLITVGSVVIEGNVFTKEYVIRRELQFQPGDILTPENINYTELRLQRLSLFGAIDIHTLETDPTLGNRTVLVRVTERNPGVFKSGIGVDNELSLSLKGFAGAAYRNLWGTGRGINGRIQINDKVKYGFLENEITLGYTEPFILGSSNNGKVNLTKSTKIYSIQTNPNNTPNYPFLVYAVDSTQADFALERDFSRKIKLIYDVYGIAHTNTYEINGQDVPNPLNIATTGPTLVYDRRDNIFNPTRGDISSLSFEYSDPNLGSTSTVNYFRSVGSFKKYIPMGRLIWANEGEAGYLRNLSVSPSGAVPPIKAFVLGGRSTIRGFEITDAFPQQTYILHGLRVDEFFYLVKSEIRFPIYGDLGGALFYDGGEVGLSEYHSQFQWRDSAGFGIRYNTPVGPLSFEYGFKLNRDEQLGESPGAFHFSIGVF